MSRSQAHATVFFAIADPTRRAILDALLTGDQTVGELVKAVSKVSQSAFSQHLAVLRKAGLVESSRAGTFQRYRLNPEPLAEVVDWAAHYSQFWDEKLDALGSFIGKERS